MLEAEMDTHLMMPLLLMAYRRMQYDMTSIVNGDARNNREQFDDYFITTEGTVPW